MPTSLTSQQREILYDFLYLEFGRRMAERWASDDPEPQQPAPEDLLGSFLGKSVLAEMSRCLEPRNE